MFRGEPLIAQSQPQDDGATYIPVIVEKVGYTDSTGMQGVLVLASDDGRRLPVSAFSGEVASHIQRFLSGDRISIPTIYNMIEELAERDSLLLERVEIYESGNVLRADLYFKTKEKELILRNYRASDAIALAVYAEGGIQVQSRLLRNVDEPSESADLR